MKQKTFARIATSIILTLAMAISAGCSSQEEISPADGKDTAADDYFDTTDTIVEVEITDEDGNTVTTVISGEPAEPTEGSSDASSEASTTSSGTNLPTVTSTQTIKPATTTTQSGNGSAVTTTSSRPSPTPTTTTGKDNTPAVTTTPAPAVTTTPAPAVTTTPQPPVTTTPAPGHTHSYSSKVTKEPTCTERGIRTYTCSCGDSYTEGINAKGHDFKTETIHHDAVIGTRDVTETWVHGYYIVAMALTPAGVDAGLNNGAEYGYPNAKQHFIKVAEYYGKPGDPDSVEWVYRYGDKTTLADMLDAAIKDFIAKYKGTNYYDPNYNSKEVATYEDRVVGTEEYIITPAYDETVTTCTVCGTRDWAYHP